MLEELYKVVTPWAIASKSQKYKNRLLGFFANILYRPYCLFVPIKSGFMGDRTDVIVSVTTYPARINEVYYCLNSLLRQSIKPYKVILWLAEEQFPNGKNDIPQRILNLLDKGLEICFCPDYRSYKKIVPTYQNYCNKIIITADDDTLYPESWMENLIKEAEHYPECVICYRAHEITFENGKIAKYKDWRGLSPNTQGPSNKLVPIGVGGVLYPLNYFEDIDFDYSVIKRLAPTTDDIWLKIIGLKKQIPAVKVFANSKEWFTVKGSQRISLRHINVDSSNANDLAFDKLLSYYRLSKADIE